jgi:hypothetical protein
MRVIPDIIARAVSARDLVHTQEEKTEGNAIAVIVW